MTKNWTVTEVEELFTETVNANFAATAKGQAHLNRIAKAITNESIEQRKATSYQTYAQKAFDKRHRELSVTDPDKAKTLAAREKEWKEAYIKKHYEEDDDF
ncbi:hypothetical protein [Geomonas edaphica]|uniref:hypothetical protein n=1 Tax=Geomonas edaphica TaxID=2570226 RepID=UPI0010A909AF|nr:hypothetical protein [Geomonas edaphica]